MHDLPTIKIIFINNNKSGTTQLLSELKREEVKPVEAESVIGGGLMHGHRGDILVSMIIETQLEFIGCCCVRSPTTF